MYFFTSIFFTFSFCSGVLNTGDLNTILCVQFVDVQCACRSKCVKCLMCITKLQYRKE